MPRAYDNMGALGASGKQAAAINFQMTVVFGHVVEEGTKGQEVRVRHGDAGFVDAYPSAVSEIRATNIASQYRHFLAAA